MHGTSFNIILQQITKPNADWYRDDIFEDEFSNLIRRLNFTEKPEEARDILSKLQSVAESHGCYLLEYELLDFVIGKGRTDCSKAVCENTFGKCPTFVDMMRHHWFEHLMRHPIATKPYIRRLPMVRNDALYWDNFHMMLSFHLQSDSRLAFEVLEYLASKGDVPAMEQVGLYYFSKNQYTKAFHSLNDLHDKMGTPEWKDHISQKVTYVLAHLYSYGTGVEQNFDKATQYFNEVDDYHGWGHKAKYQLGRIAEQRHDYWAAMCRYREIIDNKGYARCSSYRENYPNDLLPLKLEVAFRNMKKKLYPMMDSLKLETCSECRNVVIQLKVMMNARLTIDWGDGKQDSIKWKVDGWEKVSHTYQLPASYNIIIRTDEENVLTGIHVISPKSICSMDVARSKGLTHIICPDQLLEQLSLEKAEYLSVLDVHSNRLQSINLRKNELLTVIDCSRNPLRKLGFRKHPPFRQLCIRKTRLTAKIRRKLHAILRLNVGKLLREGFVSLSADPVLPTLLYYMKNCSWEEVLPILQKECGEDMQIQKQPIMHKAFTLLKAFRQVVPCPDPNGFLWVDGSWVVIVHRFKLKKTGRIIEDMTAEEEFYLYERPWSMILGTAVKAKDNRLPFMMLPQHPKVYYVAMCLYNMVNNNTEMKKYKIPKIVYEQESF